MSSSASTSKPSVPQRLRVEKATLSYKTASNAFWVALPNPSAAPARDFTVQGIEFDLGKLVIEQRIGGNADKCVLLLTLDHYDAQVEIDLKTNTKDQDVLVLELRIRSMPSCTSKLNSAAPERHDLDQFPLHQFGSSFTALQLTMLKNNFKPSARPDILRNRMASLLKFAPSKIAGDPVGAYSERVMTGLMAEETAAFRAVVPLKHCRIQAKLMGTKMWLKIWPNGLENHHEVDVGSMTIGLRYRILGSKKFNDEDEEVMADHPIFRQPKNKSWALTVEDHTRGIDAPVVGTIDNIFSLKNYKAFEGTEEDVVLEPIFSETMGQRGISAIDDFKSSCDAAAQDLAGFLTKGANSSKLPIRDIFLPGQEFDKADNDLAVKDRPAIPASWGLNDSQAAAIHMALVRKMSIIWGPAATGKSQTLAFLVLMLLRDAAEKILVCAPTNQAVDQICRRLFKLWDEYARGMAMFVRIYSESEIERQARTHQWNLLDSPSHIDHLRFTHYASKAPDRYPNYLKGRKKLRENGALNDLALQGLYDKEAKLLTERVLANARVVFVTCDLVRGGSLRVTKGKKTLVWPATTVIMDEAGCSNPVQGLTPFASFAETLIRVVFVGDHQQLPAFVQSSEAKEVWTKSVLKDAVDKGIPYTLLSVQHRQHSDLFHAVGDRIYKNRVASYHQTSNPRPFLQELLADLPINFSVGGHTWSVRSWANFINVPHGKHVTKPEGSSMNEVEVKVVEGLIKGLLNENKKALTTLDNVAVICGYLWQIDLMKQMAAKNRWDKLKILTVDSCQGDEWEVVILSLVKTSPPSGFIGDVSRANVALTRAREALYFVGNWDLWGKAPFSQGGKNQEMHVLIQGMKTYLEGKRGDRFICEPSLTGVTFPMR